MSKSTQPWIEGLISGLGGGTVASALLSVRQSNAADIISALAQLLWPISFLVLIIVFRDDVRGLVFRLRKGKFAGAEIELERGSEKPPPREHHRERTAMEYKILKTSWTKQVNRFPKYEGVWTFRLNSSAPEFLEFREAAGKLMGEGLIGETDQGHHFLTAKGFEYCKKNHHQFPEDEWWPTEKIEPEQLKVALDHEPRSNQSSPT